jgi:tripeptide aminopeptidase
MKDQYYNMAEVMKDHMDLIDRAKDAIRRLGYEPLTAPIRGGTDGAVLSFRGLPCPNLPTGGYNYHSRFEYASIQEMELSARLLIDLAGK